MLTNHYNYTIIIMCILLASFPGSRRTAWQLLRVQTVYRCNVTAISHSSGEYWISVHVILMILPAVRTGLSCSRKQMFAAVSTIEVKQRDVQTEINMRSAYTSAIEQSPLKWNGCDRDISMHDTIRFYYYHVTF